MRRMQQELGNLGTISAFAYRHRETKKHLCRGGRSQDLPDTDFQPAIRHLGLNIVTATANQWLGVYREFLRRQTSEKKVYY